MIAINYKNKDINTRWTSFFSNFVFPIFVLFSSSNDVLANKNIDSTLQEKKEILVNDALQEEKEILVNDTLLIYKSLDVFTKISKFEFDQTESLKIYFDWDRRNMPKYKVFSPKRNTSGNWNSIDIIYDQINLCNIVIQLNDDNQKTLTIKNNDNLVYKVNFIDKDWIYILSDPDFFMEEEINLVIKILEDINNYLESYLLE